jgi:hypothetical protein
MGKRELLLIVAFVFVGSAVYWATAPAAAPGQRGFSLTTILDHMRREVRGNQASAELTSTTTLPLRPGLSEVRFEVGNAPITVVGETRPDISCELGVWSSGFDESEAKKYAAATKLKVTDAGSSLVLSIEYPVEARQRATLTVKMPSSLAVRVQPNRSKLVISSVAGVELADARGQVTVSHIKGRVAATHRGGELTIQSVTTVKLNVRGSNVVLKEIAGEVIGQLQAGELRGSGLAGPIEIESNNTRVSLDGLADMRKPIRVTATGGSVSLDGVASDTRVEGRNTRIEVQIDRPAPVAVYNENDEPTRITLPSGGFQLDALVTAGKLDVPSGLIDVKISGEDQRASGVVRGGGPTITLRSSRGWIEIRERKELGAGS